MTGLELDAIPMLETAVGLYGSLAQASDPIGPSLFEVIVTLCLIIYD
jgi:hypothetical protein